VTPGVNGQPGHDFYQFSPELYYRILSPENGFRVKHMFWKTQHRAARWYRIADPAVVGRRASRLSVSPASLFVAAERIADMPVLRTPPQQSDYVTAWERHVSAHHGDVPSPPRTLKHLVWRLLSSSKITNRWMSFLLSFRDFRRVNLCSLS
jgi:hypothetical protein